ncbi:cysteine hydrolase [Metabacillus sp. GX 13764]|uniref:cysteine hydrolase family protein n=1 Tax=Metabacillus kandeliae TaxID=2900151 RepID=UPI001E37BFF9|nr:cysteine hydrolase family protein [Metabacillus kandeliae]MCD7036006.1 cysteine hydrolase [Metabacillus kandeliae]
MKQALLVIDAQQDLIEGNHEEQEVFQKEVLIAAINKVIKEAKANGAYIVFVRDLDVAGGEGAGFQVHRDIEVPDDAAIFDKQATNSFYKTGLLPYLKEKEISHLVIMGCKTEHCIDTAVRTATVEGFDVTLAGDGHSTADTAVLSAEQVIAHHNQVLHGHYNVDHFSIVRHSDEKLFEPEHDKYRE